MKDADRMRIAFIEYVKIGMVEHKNMPRWLTIFADEINHDFPECNASCWFSSDFGRVALIFKGKVLQLDIKDLNI